MNTQAANEVVPYLVGAGLVGLAGALIGVFTLGVLPGFLFSVGLVIAFFYPGLLLSVILWKKVPAIERIALSIGFSFILIPLVLMVLIAAELPVTSLITIVAGVLLSLILSYVIVTA